MTDDIEEIERLLDDYYSYAEMPPDNGNKPQYPPMTREQTERYRKDDQQRQSKKLEDRVNHPPLTSKEPTFTLDPRKVEKMGEAAGNFVPVAGNAVSAGFKNMQTAPASQTGGRSFMNGFKGYYKDNYTSNSKLSPSERAANIATDALSAAGGFGKGVGKAFGYGAKVAKSLHDVNKFNTMVKAQKATKVATELGKGSDAVTSGLGTIDSLKH
jgi:hypothetical protein